MEATIKLNREQLPPVTMDISFPQTWNDLTQANLLYIARRWEAWQQLAKLEQSLRKAKAMLFLELCGFKNNSDKKKLSYILSFVDENTDINVLDFTKFIFDELTLTRQLIPEIKFGFFKSFHGPGDRLNDISIEEFSFAFSAYMQYIKTSDPAYLGALAGTLYRDKASDYKKTGERRVPFNYKLISLNAKYFAGIDEDYGYAVLLFFKGCLNYFEPKYPAVFSRATSSVLSGSGTFIETIVQMSGSEFGPFKDTKDTNLHLVLSTLNRKIIESQKKK